MRGVVVLLSCLIGVWSAPKAPNATGEPEEPEEPDWKAFAKGVNLGGWLLLEDWIFPQTMQGKGIVDEWNLVKSLGGPTHPMAVRWFEEHWSTFITKEDIYTIKGFGMTHVRVPVGWWIIDYNVGEGFVDGGMKYLDQLISWCGEIGLMVIVDLHALPGAQVPFQSFTGHSQDKPYFFDNPSKYAQGNEDVLKLAQHIQAYETDRDHFKHNVVVGMQLCNEPAEDRWPQVQKFYTDIVPKIRGILPAKRYAVYLSIMNDPEEAKYLWGNNSKWLEPSEMNIIYDRHVYHAFGDNDFPPWGGDPRPPWRRDMDSCKTCCRDPNFFVPTKGIPTVIGEWSLTTATIDIEEEKDHTFLNEFWENQLSLWHNIEQGRGYFFWTWKLGPSSTPEYFINFDLSLMVTGAVSLEPDAVVDTSSICPTEDLSECPTYDPATLSWKANCDWKNAPSPVPGSCEIYAGRNCYGNDIASAGADNYDICCSLCQNMPGCKAWTLDQYSPSGQFTPWCYMKSSCPSFGGNPNAVSGLMVQESKKAFIDNRELA